MAWMDSLPAAAGGLLSICALAAAMDLLSEDDGTALGFRSVCGLAIALFALRIALRLVG